MLLGEHNLMLPSFLSCVSLADVDKLGKMQGSGMKMGYMQLRFVMCTT